MAKVWAESTHSGTHLLMMLAIADFADDEGNAYPSVPTLADKCRMKPRNANVIVGDLSGAIKALPTGDTSKLVELLNSVPPEMRQEVTASSDEASMDLVMHQSRALFGLEDVASCWA